ncbi:hypothetical protein SPONL_957 [uncultured Candidatus Thioglobus sp.]|nr:hypothetical protein SPONL_957 [uncultured Candidatus Thioglobus sp.]
MEFELNAALIKGAITSTMKTFLALDKPLEGITAMEKAVEDIPTWQYLQDWKWHARFAYQSLEKRGTGGGNFRFMYADFLDEASAFIPKIATLKLANEFRISAKKWQQFAGILKTIFIEGKPEKFTAATEKLQQIMQVEKELCQLVLKQL